MLWGWCTLWGVLWAVCGAVDVALRRRPTFLPKKDFLTHFYIESGIFDTRTDSNGKTWERIDKKTARTAYNNGLTVLFCPVNMRPFTPWHLEIDINKNFENPRQNTTRAKSCKLSTSS